MELQKSLLETWKFFSRFLNTLTADDKYSLSSRDNWMQITQMHLSEKQKIFFAIFFSIFRICMKFWIFSEKDDPNSLCISQISDNESRP